METPALLWVLFVLQLTIGHLVTCADNNSFYSTDIRTVVAHLARQVQLLQFAQEERIRTDGGSGLKQQRAGIVGSRPTNAKTHAGYTIAAIHDHADHERTLGMGEGVYVMNGVEFRTRHNDYPLYMPHRTSSEYNAMEPIPFPEVPPSVLEKEDISAQITEMKKYFTAWLDQDHSVVDYRPYFRAVLCYMEGAWTAAPDVLEEGFHSNRHFIDAEGWLDLHEKVRFNAFVGRKNIQENFAYLPRTIINITEEGLPVYAQWNYRILCHPLKRDLPVQSLVQEDDLQARMIQRKTFKEFKEFRGARFRVEGLDESRTSSYTLLDELMTEIPGRDNYQGELTETSFGDVYTDPAKDTLLNVAYFHRRYNFGKRDAMGLRAGKRGFTDFNMWVAETTQENIAPMYARMCDNKGTEQCYEAKKRVTYAIPLEIIYLTPLHLWNPYQISFSENPTSAQMTDNGRRNGGFTKETAYKAAGPKLYYKTPAEFFTGSDTAQTSAADTASSVVGMLDADGYVQNVTASGCRIILPEIEGLGALRLRYPIMPVHGEGGSVWKELDALKGILMDLRDNQMFLHQPIPPPSSTNNPNKDKNKNKVLAYVVLSMANSTVDSHSHLVNITREERTRIMNGKTINVVSSLVNGHSHRFTMAVDGGRFYIVRADGRAPPTYDGHSEQLQWRVVGYTDGTIVTRSKRRKRWAEDPQDDLPFSFDDTDLPLTD